MIFLLYSTTSLRSHLPKQSTSIYKGTLPVELVFETISIAPAFQPNSLIIDQDNVTHHFFVSPPSPEPSTFCPFNITTRRFPTIEKTKKDWS